MRIRPTAAVLILTACSASTTDDPNPRGPVLLTDGMTLQGRALESSRDGVWVVRRTTGTVDGTTTTWAMDDAKDGAVRGLLAPEVAFEAGATAPTGASSDFAAGPGAAPPAAPTMSVAAGSSAPPVEALRAGSTDDNADLAAFEAFLAQMAQRDDLGGRWQPFDVRDAKRLRVVDANGAPLPGVPVQLVDEATDRVAWRGTTLGDGRIPVYPHAAGLTGPCLIEATVAGERVRHHWDLKSDECVVRAPGVRAADAPVALDVVFVIDTTGSMGDEIDRVKATLLAVTQKLRSLEREFTLRYGAVLYRDVGDAYVTSAHAFTADIAAFDEALGKIEASGGGDGPESLNQGLAVAVDGMDWRADTAHVAFLIADAPPHMDYTGDIPYPDSIRAAIGKGIRVHAVAASGLDEAGSIVFRQIAQATRGEFVFIEYGGNVAASGEAHGVHGVTRSNNLDDILFEKLRDEIARFGRADDS